MGSEWVETTIGNLCQKVVTGGTPLKSNDAFYENADIPWLKTKEVNFCRIYETENFVSDLALRKSSVKLIPENSVIVAMYGQGDTAGRVAINKIPLTTNQACCNLIIDASKADYRFIYFYLKNSYQELVRRKTGSAQPNLNTNIIKSFEVKAPPLDLQIKIGEILGSLDDKIELNRQINTTLEAMAQALFKSWFVDFDPVIDNALAAGNPIPPELAARAERRQQHHTRANTSADAQTTPYQPLPADIQQQFPDRFVFTEAMGWVPEGWEVSTVGDQIETTGGGTPSTQDESFWEGGVHAFCTPKDMSQLTSWVLMDTERHLTDAGVKKVSSGLLPVGTVLMSSRAPIGYLAISDIPVSVNQGIIAMLPNSKFGPLYLLNWAKFNMGKITDRANGSTFLEISKKNFRPIPFLAPSGSIAQRFNEETKAIYSKILLLSEQISNLTKLRDSLLPKLLSGQLRIPDAEAAVEKALAEA